MLCNIRKCVIPSFDKKKSKYDAFFKTSNFNIIYLTVYTHNITYIGTYYIRVNKRRNRFGSYMSYMIYYNIRTSELIVNEYLYNMYSCFHRRFFTKFFRRVCWGRKKKK